MKSIIYIILLVLFTLPLKANSTTKIEQQINLVDQIYTTSSTTAEPANNSLGFFTWDSRLYTSPTVDFEAILYCDNCSGGNAAAKAILYDEDNNPINNVAVSTQDSAYQRVRVVDIGSNLTDNTKYTVRLFVDATLTGTAYLKTARLIISQEDTAIAKTRTTIDLGDNTESTAESFTVITNPKIFIYNSNRHSSILAINFEASLSSSDESGTAYAVLVMGGDCNSTVANSEISVTGTTWTLTATSTDLTSSLSDGVKYSVCIKSSAGSTAYMANARLVIDQSNEAGIEKITLVEQYNNTLITTTSDTYISALYENQYNPSHFSADRVKAYYETTFKSSDGTAKNQLYNSSDSNVIDSSEITSNAHTYDLFTSSDIYAKLPTSTSSLDPQLQNSIGAQTSISNSWLLFEISEKPDPAMTFSLSGVNAGTSHNGITTSVTTATESLNFGNLTPGIPKYAAHQLYVSTNTESGYQLTLKMLNYLQGIYPANNIDPFISTWNEPVIWSTPTGTTPNDNTGWFGANTSDTRISGWENGASKFGPVNNSSNPVMASTGTDSGTTVFVTYAVETNILQAADQYSGTVIYNLIPTY